MLNIIAKDCDDSVCSSDNNSAYSMILAAHVSNTDIDGTDNESKNSFDGSVASENIDMRGTLIVQGEDEDEKGGDENENSKHDDDGKASSTILSVPETVFLPSEIRSVGIVSVVTHEQQNIVGDKCTNLTNSILGKWNQLLSFGSRLWAGICVASYNTMSFNAMQLLPVLMMFVALVSVTSWNSHVWKNEALRLREELQTLKPLVPLTLSLLKERDDLIKKQKLLKEDIEHAKKERDGLIKKQKLLEEDIEHAKMNGPQSNNYEDFFSPDKSDDSDIISIKNCYVEASLSLGQCTKDWQNWFSYAANDNNAHSSTEETGNNEPPSYDEGFTDDMSKLVKSFTNGLTSTTKQSYAFLEKTAKDLSYDGIKDALSRDDYIQSIVKYIPKMSSKNDTGDEARVV